ncbi:MAG: LysR family transcriptional regulator [Gammaproteobacteria bacterium CG22_combo_CG10-13_8_21_14_all_40_8]|nr:MAG: LysR family transcriptional regulator [Gammaproteobacteria bacterium CG22_combo_CG10-13_8_21_14_all_40_8]
MFDLNLTAIFAKVVETQSLTKAAQELGIPKATVSRKLASLEDELGVRLIQRTTRRLNLTDTGRQYYRSCQEALATVHEANLEASQTQEAPTGVLKISAPTAFGDQFLSSPLIQFRQMYPQINLQVNLTDRVIDLVEEDIDITFRVGLLANSSYVSRRLGKTSQLIVASPKYLQQHGVPKSPKDLQQHQVIGYSENLGKKTLVFEGVEGSVSINVSPSIIVNNINIMKNFCTEDLGITIIPLFLALEALRKGELKIILPEWRFQFGDLYLLYPSKKHLATKVRVFIDFIANQYATEQPWLPSTEQLKQYIYNPKTKD